LIKPFTIDINMSYYQMSNDELMKYSHHWFWVVLLISAIQM